MLVSPDGPAGKRTIIGLWAQLFGISLWFSTTYGQFLYFNLELAMNTGHAVVVVGLGALTSAVVIALSLNAAAVFRTASRVSFWYFSSAILMLLLIALVFLYSELHYLWTCQAELGVSLLKGSTPTPELLAFMNAGNVECGAFSRFPGYAGHLYASGSVWPRYQLLALLYIFAWAVLSALIISVVHCFKIGRQIR